MAWGANAAVGTNVRGAVPLNVPVEAALVAFISSKFEARLVARVPDMGGRVAFRLLEVLVPVFDSIESTRLRSEIREGGKPGSFGVPSSCKYPLRVRRRW